MVTLMEWVNKNLGKPIDIDGRYGAQCVDLPNGYARDVFGLKYSSGNGKDKAANFARDYGWTFIGPKETARAGDVVSWGPTWGGGYGHTGVVIADEGSRLRVFHQNPKAPAIASLSKDGLVGYARPKNAVTAVATTSAGPKAYVVTTSGLNRRTKPGVDSNGKLYPIYGTSPLYKGATWHATGYTHKDKNGQIWIEGRSDWQVSAKAEAAWVNSAYVKEV